MDKMTFYTVIENQVSANGSYALLYNHYTDMNAALAKYYTICAAAAISELPYHSAHIVASEEVAKTSAVVCTLLGTLLSISTAQYNKQEPPDLE